MSDIYFILFYGVIFVVVLYLILSMLRPSTIIVEQPTTVPLWPWPITSYNWWPYWYGASNGGSGGGYSGTTRVYPSVDRPWGGASRMANGSGGGHHDGGHGGGRGGGGGHGGGHGGH